LRELSDGSLPLSHQGLDAAPNGGTAEHLRSLLVDVGLLEARDENLARFDHFVADRLPAVAETADDLKLLQLFATWQQRPYLMSHKAAVGEASSIMRPRCSESRPISFGGCGRETGPSLPAHRLTSTHGSPRPFRPGPTLSASCAGQATLIAVRGWPWRAATVLVVRRSTKPAGSGCSDGCWTPRRDG
jgi:hypothetical protein